MNIPCIMPTLPALFRVLCLLRADFNHILQDCFNTIGVMEIVMQPWRIRVNKAHKFIKNWRHNPNIYITDTKIYIIYIHIYIFSPLHIDGIIIPLIGHCPSDIELATHCCLGRHQAWWRHQMETFSALLTICVGNSPVPGEVPAQRPVTRSFDVFFDLRLNKRLSKQSWGWWFETLPRPLWRQCNWMIAHHWDVDNDYDVVDDSL